MNLKNILKQIKINESSISMILGAVVIVIVGILVINYFKKPAGETIPATTVEESEEKIAEVGETHSVVKGETLWSIAEDAYGSGYNWVDIANDNNISNPSSIEEGQKISIPDVNSKFSTVIESEEVNTNESISTDTYIVVKGDNLWDIAVRTYGDGYRWTDIANANKLINPNLIHAGNELILPR